MGDDLVAPVGYDKFIRIWRISETQEVGRWEHDKELTAVARLDRSRIAVGENDGSVIILEHATGTSMYVEKKVTWYMPPSVAVYKSLPVPHTSTMASSSMVTPAAHSRRVRHIAVYRNRFLTCSTDAKVIVWCANSFRKLATFYHGDPVYSATITKEFIITASFELLRVYVNEPESRLLSVLRIPCTAKHIQVLGYGVVAISSDSGFLDFISLAQKSYLARCKLSTGYLNSFVILTDARIAVGEENGFACMFLPPSQVEDVVDNCAVQLLPSSALSIQRLYPLRAACNAVQNDTLSLADACKTAITSDNCQRNIEE